MNNSSITLTSNVKCTVFNCSQGLGIGLPISEVITSCMISVLCNPNLRSYPDFCTNEIVLKQNLENGFCPHNDFAITP